MRSPAPFPTASMNLRLAEEVLYDLPPLEGVFLHWHTHGVTATTPGITSLLHRREQLLGAATLPGASLKLLYACPMDCLHPLPMQTYPPWDNRPLPPPLLLPGPHHRPGLPPPSRGALARQAGVQR